MVPRVGVEPTRYQVSRDFKSLASTSSATQAINDESLDHPPFDEIKVFKKPCQDFIEYFERSL